MTILGISAAARAAGVNRSTLQRAIKTGRLSATIDAAGERGIDLAELLRVFGPLRQMPQEDSAALPQPAAPIAAADATMVELLREQLRQAQERERQAQEREVRLLTMLETAQQVLQAEQQARRDLEQKLLPPPPPPQPEPPPHRHHRRWLLLAILALAVAALVWTRTSAYWPLGE